MFRLLPVCPILELTTTDHLMKINANHIRKMLLNYDFWENSFFFFWDKTPECYVSQAITTFLHRPPQCLSYRRVPQYPADLGKILQECITLYINMNIYKYSSSPISVRVMIPMLCLKPWIVPNSKYTACVPILSYDKVDLYHS